MERVRVPGKIKIRNRTYIYQEQCNNNLFLYKEEKMGFKECFTMQDLVEIKNQKKGYGARV